MQALYNIVLLALTGLVLLVVSVPVQSDAAIRDTVCSAVGLFCPKAPGTVVDVDSLTNVQQGDITAGDLVASSTFGASFQGATFNQASNMNVILDNIDKITTSNSGSTDAIIQTLVELETQRAQRESQQLEQQQQFFNELLRGPPPFPITVEELQQTAPIQVELTQTTDIPSLVEAIRELEFNSNITLTTNNMATETNATTLPATTNESAAQWLRWSATNAVAPVAADTVGIPAVTLADADGAAASYYELAANVPTTLEQVVTFSFVKTGGNLNAMAFELRDAGGANVSTAYINSTTGALTTAVVGTGTAFTLESSSINDSVITVSFRVAANAAYTQWRYYPTISLNASQSTVDTTLTGSQEIVSLDLNDVIGQGTDLHRVRMRRAASQALTAVTQNTILFDTEDYDVGGLGNTGTGEVTIVNSGTYTIAASGGANNAANNSQIQISVDGVAQKRSINNVSSNGSVWMHNAIATLPLTAGQVITAQVFTENANTTSTTLEDQVVLEVVQIPTKEVVPANSVEVTSLSHAVFSLSGDQAITANGQIINFDTTDFTTGTGIATDGAGTFTLQPGTYAFDFRVAKGNAGSQVGAILHNLTGATNVGQQSIALATTDGGGFSSQTAMVTKVTIVSATQFAIHTINSAGSPNVAANETILSISQLASHSVINPTDVTVTQVITATGGYEIIGTKLRQWGFVSGAAGTRAVTLPIAYPNNTYNATGGVRNTINAGGGFDFQAGNQTTTGFDGLLTFNNGSSVIAAGEDFTWETIGLAP